MASINVRSGYLYIDFRYQGKRCREQTLLLDTPANRIKLKKWMEQLDTDIKLGVFQYAAYFPESKRAKLFTTADIAAREKKEVLLCQYNEAAKELRGHTSIPFNSFSQEWYEVNRVRWKHSYRKIVIHNLKYLNLAFGEQNIDQITRSEILKFRAGVMDVRDDGKQLSSEFINHMMTTLRMILAEGAHQYGFKTPFENIKSLSVRRTDVDPFTIEEVFQFLAGIRADFHSYFLVRFFTGMRSSEIDGLRWEYVDFKKGLILIRKTWVERREETTKNDGSTREIEMSSMVRDALEKQFKVSGQGTYVFPNKFGKPLDRGNVRDRIWKPALKQMGIKYRRPYETRHTAATLWLAAGEAPEWIARQMGHSTTKMLFTVYSRYVPNLTRRDGSAFEALIQDIKKEQKHN